MINKIQNNVHSMLNEVQKITRMGHHQRKHTAQINNYIEALFAPRSLITSSKNIRSFKEPKKRSNTTAQNQKQIERNDSQKRLKTEILSHSVQYRLQPHTNKKEIMTLQPNQSELLSTKIFGLNKPKFLKKVKQSCLPKIKRGKNINTLNQSQQSRVLKGQTINVPPKICLVSSLYPEQNMILIRHKKKRSLSRHLIKKEEFKSPALSSKRHFVELNQLQPWESQRAQNEFFQR